MKKAIFAIFFGMILSGTALAQEAAPTAKFKKNEHSFGAIKESLGTVTTQFEFTNTGKSPLIIQRISTSCGCTTPSYSREPILPGKKGVVTASYSTTGRPGNFNKNLTVYTNVPDTVYVLTIKGNVVPDVK